MNDRQLVDQFIKSKSERAFKALYRSKTPRLYQMALRLTTHDPHQAEELIQETWIIALRKLESFEWRSELKTWLTGILINLYRDKRKKSEREAHLLHGVREEASFDIDISTKYDLEAAISKLPPGFRQVILLYAIEGYKHKEIAKILDISEGTSKSQLFHARNALRQLLQDESEKSKLHE